MLEYETANPEQDDDGEEKAVVTPDAVAAADVAQGSGVDISNNGMNGRSGTNKPAQAPARGYGYDQGPYLEAAGPKRAARPD